ncbi:MAG: hypothetical protein WKF97_00165 [Chitinophagaceae bacterium]
MKAALNRIPEPFFVFSIFFVFYLLNLTENFSGPHDSMSYLNEIRQGKGLFQPHHLLYHFTTYHLLHFLQIFFSNVQPYYLVAIIDCVWGCLSLAIAYQFFRNRFLFSRAEAFCATSVIAFSFGMWFYSTNVEVYMPPLFFLLCGLYITTKEFLTKRDVVLLAIVHSLAILFHQSNVLFTPIVLWKLWQSRKAVNLGRSILQYALIGILLVAGSYVIAGWWIEGHNDLQSFNTWIRGYTTNTRYWFPFNASTAVKAVIGFGHAIIGGHFIFKVGLLSDYLNKLFFYHSLSDEPYVVRNLSDAGSTALLLLTIILFFLLMVLLIRVIVHFRGLLARHRTVLIPLLLFFLIYSLFFFFWMPEILEFWIPQTAVFWMLLLGLTKSIQRVSFLKRRYTVFLAIAVLLFIINFFGSIYWLKDLKNDIVYAKIKKIKAVATEKDVILLRDGWLVKDFLEYFTKSIVREIPTDQKRLALLNGEVNNCLRNGGQLYLFTEGASIHASKNNRYIDSLLNAYPSKSRVFQEELTMVKIISTQ